MYLHYDSAAFLPAGHRGVFAVVAGWLLAFGLSSSIVAGSPELSGYIASRPLGTAKVEAYLDDKKAALSEVSGKKGKTKVVVQAKGKQKTVTNASELPKGPQDVSVIARLSSKPGAKAQAESFKTPAEDKWDHVKDDINTESDVRRADQAFKNLERLTEALIKVGSPLKDDSNVESAYKRAQDELAKLYGDVLARKNPLNRTRVAGAYAGLVTEKKAVFGRKDNYVPDVYNAIFQRSKACVGLVHPEAQGGAPHGAWRPTVSGVLIAPDLVLTCSHEITNETLGNQDIEVWFGYEQDLNGTPRPKTTAKVLGVKYDGIKATPARPLDFAVFQIEHTDLPPAPLTDAPVQLDAPVYVVGLPRGEYEVVHDNAHVMFPFEVTEAGYKNLILSVHASLIGQEEDSAQATDDLLGLSYEKTPVSTQKNVYRYFLSLNGEHMPVMGADCDTFHGDSGAGVFLRNSSECCGILMAGEPDNRTFEGATFQHHEKILPFKVINERLSDPNNGLPGWPGAYGVTVKH